MAKRNNWRTEDSEELSEETKRDIEKARAEIKLENFIRMSRLKRC